MPLDPQMKAYIDQLASFNMPPMSTLQPAQIREGMRMQIQMTGETEPIAHVENRTIPGPAGQIPIRVYRPAGDDLFPVLVFFHGGGWVIGDLDTHDGQCRSLANGTNCVVVSVDYRLAPEHPFPAAPKDCYAATNWVAEHADEVHGDPRHIAVGGDSAGGNLAAVVAQMARDQGGPKLVFQLLVYPATNFQAETASLRENSQGYGLVSEDMAWFKNHYLNGKDETGNPQASPLLATDLSNLPPALIITAEFDPLRDEGEEYGQRLQAAGVPVTISRYDGVIHGFFGMATILDKAKLAINEACQALRTAFSTR
jgi:acetyl esterase